MPETTNLDLSNPPKSLAGKLLPDANDDGLYDLCDKVGKNYLDVIRSEATGCWRGMYANKQVVGPFETRDRCRAELLRYVAGLLP